MNLPISIYKAKRMISNAFDFTDYDEDIARLNQELLESNRCKNLSLEQTRKKDELLKDNQVVIVSLVNQLIGIKLSAMVDFESWEWEINFSALSSQYDYIYSAIKEKKKLHLSINNGQHYAFCKFDGMDRLVNSVNFTLELFQRVTEGQLDHEQEQSPSTPNTKNSEHGNCISAEDWISENIGELQSFTSDINAKGDNAFSITIDGDIIFKGVSAKRFDRFVAPNEFSNLAEHFRVSLGLTVEQTQDKMNISWNNNIPNKKKEV